MSTLKTNTLSNLAGSQSTPIENAINGSAKAWVNFNGTGTIAIRASYNVSSLTDNGTGNYRVNFTNALVDTNYSAFITSGHKAVHWGIPMFSNATPFLVGSVGVTTQNPADTGEDNNYVCVSVFR